MIRSVVLVWLLAVSIAGAIDEKNGLRVTVAKKTLDRNDTRGGYYSYDRIERTMGLKVTVKNVSMKDFPAGELEYSILVKNYNYSPTTYELYQGKESLSALRLADSVDVVIGAAEINGWRDSDYHAQDKLDYQIIIKHGGKETIRVASNPAFDAMARRAIKVTASH